MSWWGYLIAVGIVIGMAALLIDEERNNYK